MRVSYIKYTTCNKIMEEEKEALSHKAKIASCDSAF